MKFNNKKTFEDFIEKFRYIEYSNVEQSRNIQEYLFKNGFRWIEGQTCFLDYGVKGVFYLYIANKKFRLTIDSEPDKMYLITYEDLSKAYL